MQFEWWTALQPSEKGRPDLQVLNIPERTQVDDGAPWHGARGAGGPGRPSHCPRPASDFPIGSRLWSKLSSRLRMGSTPLSWSPRSPTPSPGKCSTQGGPDGEERGPASSSQPLCLRPSPRVPGGSVGPSPVAAGESDQSVPARQSPT
ncbi:hypothetical protein J1605_003398 [Eschrichtius robustus]|uniref:Uncharacterized protein n=1 Tax=Eschrichtius robustus TaxID=9764 RepID=A0AB34HP43_ESCRO|nr:hypothetical protein J1605_003398 [Eschrichtius robustus]